MMVDLRLTSSMYKLLALFASFFFLNPCFAEVNKKELDCLSEIVYFEGRGESQVGKEMIVAVVVNRTQTKGFPSSICGNLYKPHQFSFVRDTSRQIKNLNEYKSCRELALNRRTFLHKYPKNMLYFKRKELVTKWSKKKKLYKIEGNHSFHLM